jgi:putative peptide zinc metalloprotease protein
MSSAPTMAPSLPVGQAAEHLKVKLRPDLIVQPQFYEGMTHYVIKDPIALKYFRFKVEEYFLLQQFDGKQTLQEVKRVFERKYRPQTITVDDLLRFASQLHEAGIALIDSPDQAKALVRRHKKNKWKKIWQFFANILYIKIPVVDPEKMLSGMYPYFRWIYTSWFIAFSVGMMLAALILVGSQYQTFSARLPDFQSFFNWHTIVYFWCSLAIIKVIHEFGHGLTAKHFGGEVHEMGMLFLVLTPALYCDVTDSWLLPSKWKRIWISAAGIYVECFLASIATFVWWNTEQGLWNSLSMATMFICSVNTIMFNANPLLRYDGYYVMSDWLEIPNLRTKSTQFFAYLFQEYVLGLEVPVQSYMPRSRRSLFVIYAIASYLYRWLVTFSILYFLSQWLRPYKLQSVSYMIAGASLVPLLLMPLYQGIKFIRQPGRMRKVKKVRATIWAVATVAVVTGILLIPTPLRVQGTLSTTVAKPAEIYAAVPGRLVTLNVRDGDMVKKGDILATLSNPEKFLELQQLQEQQAASYVKMVWFGTASDTESRAQRQKYLQMQEQLEEPISRISDQIGMLNLVAPRDGQAIGVPHPSTIGQYLKPGKPVMEVGDPHKLEAHVILDQSDIDLIKSLDSNKPPIAWIKIYGTSETTWKSHVSETAQRNQEDIPTEVSIDAGGEIATKQDKTTGKNKPLTPVYEAIIPIDNPDLLLQPGLRGFAKIDAGHSTLAWWLWRMITKTFHFTL